MAGVGDLLPRYLQDPFAIFTQGLRVDGSSRCADATSFTRTVRNIVRRVGGLAPDSSSALKMCLPDLKGIADKANGWASTVTSGCKGGTCLSLPPVPAEVPSGSSYDCTTYACSYDWRSRTSCCPARAAGGPAVIAGFGPLAPRPSLAPGAVLAPDAADSLLSPLTIDARAPVLGSTSALFVASLVPSSGSRTAAGGISNAVKGQLRRGLAWALARRGWGQVSSGSIAITSVSAPGSGGAHSIGFSVTMPPGADPSVLAGVRAELTSSAPGSVGASAGTWLAWAGVVNAADAAATRITAVADAAASPSNSPAASLQPGASPSNSRSAAATVPPGVSPSSAAIQSSAAPSPLATVFVFTTLTLTGVSLTDATSPAVWAALRRSYTCTTFGLPPSLAIEVSISDGRATMSYSAADTFNNPVIGGTSCARRRLQVTDGGSSTGARQLQSGGGNLTVVLRMSIPASAVASASPAPGQSVNEAQALAQVTLVNSFIARTANTGT